MNEAFELLPTVILAVGLVLGAALAWWLMRRGDRLNAEDVDLERRDLELRRDEIYSRLKDERDQLNTADRAALERSAAEILRRLDALPAAQTPKAKRPQPQAATTLTARRPLLTGAMLGGGMVGLLAVLIFLAQRDAQPVPEQPTTTSSTATGGSEAPFDRGQPPLPPEIAQRVADLEQRLEASPNDIPLRRDLMTLLLSHGQFFDAFQQSRTLLEINPGDPEALYAGAIVRYTMGQPEAAIEELDQALQSQPGYADAALMKGLMQLQIGEREAAIGTWEQGLAAAGNSRSLEHVLDQARAGKSAQEILANPPPQ